MTSNPSEAVQQTGFTHTAHWKEATVVLENSSVVFYNVTHMHAI